LLLLLRKYELADKLMDAIDKKVLELDGSRVLPSAGRFDHYMTTAIDHIEKGRFKDALYNLDRALELKPNHDEVWQMRATAMLELGKLEEALESCQKATGLRPSNHTAWYFMGLIRGQMGDYDGEVKAYDIMLRLQPNNRSALLNKGTALYRMHRLEQALKVYDQMIKAHPKDAMAYNNHGIVLKAIGRKEEALGSFSRAAALDRNYVNPIINSGLVHSDMGQEALAIEDWQRALQLERRRPEIWLSLGLSQRAIGHLEEAVFSFNSALILEPGLEEAKRNLREIEALLAPPKPEEPVPVDATVETEPALAMEEPMPEEIPEVAAEEPMELAVRDSSLELIEIEKEERRIVTIVEPRSPAIMEGKELQTVPEAPLPAVIEGPGPLMESRTEESRVMKMPVPEPSKPLVIVRPGPLMESRTEESRIMERPSVPAVEERALKPGIPQVAEEPAAEEPMEQEKKTLLTARLLMLVGDNETAIKELDRALTDDQGSEGLITMKAKALLDLGRFDEAVPLLRDLYSRTRDERLLYDLESISYIFGRKADGPTIMANAAPSKESLARELSLLLEKRQYDDLIAKAAKADKLSSERTRQAHALALMMKARYRDAAKIWKLSLDVNPGKAEALNNLGVCMRFMGEFGYDEPIQYMRLATMIDPEYGDAWNNVGCVYFAIGVYEEALQAFQKAISIDRRPDYYLNLSSVQMAMSDVAGAKLSLASALKLEESPEVFFMLAVIAEKEGDMRWSASLYEDAVRLKPDFKDAIFNLQRVKLFLKYNK
ncbi:MAG TPA: tetratricopeptide repeat protein, partial [Methanomassiliicoccales archaeon]|nr:tetratricopeptide repeat protein [Methanomassiliicoccales archaeon]